MEISSKDLKDFKSIFKKQYWFEISDQEALELWSKFLDLMQNILFDKIKKDV